MAFFKKTNVMMMNKVCNKEREGQGSGCTEILD